MTCRGVTPGPSSSSDVTLPLPRFHISTPPGLTSLTPYPPVDRRYQAIASRTRAGSLRMSSKSGRLLPMSTRNAASITGVSRISESVCRAASGGVAASTTVV